MIRCLTATLACAALFAVSIASPARADHQEKVKEMTPPKDSKEFAMKAAEGGMLEVKLSQLAEQKAQNAQVKQFAQRMIQDHTQANQQLMAIAKQKSIDLPSDLKGECKDTYEAFQALDGPAFDANYVLFNIKDHLHDIMAFRHESMNGTDPDIKNWAAQTLPTLRQHAGMLGPVAEAVGIPLQDLTSTGASGTAHGHGTDTAQPAGSRQGPTGGTGTSGGSTGTGTTDTPKR